MTSTLLDQPILNLAIDNLSQLNNIDEKQLSTIWNLFTKCKDNLENGRRLENISWRLWYRSCHQNDNTEPIDIPELTSCKKSKATFSPASFSKVVKDFSKPSQTPIAKTPIVNEVIVEPNQNVSKTLFDLVEVPVQELDKSVRNRPTFYISSASLSEVTDSSSDSASSSIVPEMNYHSHVVEMKRSTVNDSVSQHSMASVTEYDDDFSDYSDDSESCYGESWSYTPSPMFRKVNISNKPLFVTVNSRNNNNHPKQKSLLSAALSRKKSKTQISRESQGNEISSSLKETLLWDRCMPFNTTIHPLRKFKTDKGSGVDWNDELDNCW